MTLGISEAFGLYGATLKRDSGIGPRMKMRNALLGLGLSATAACSNPLSFGPGRVEIKLDQAAVRAVPHEVLFPGSARRAGVPSQRDALVLVVSSELELLSYFKERHRDLQVRCRVEGNQGNRTYRGFALGPIPEPGHGANETTSAVQNRHRYTIYSFIDLQADDDVYEGGKPATTLELREAGFASLNCHLLGVVKAPALFPRSNDVVVTADTFRDLLRAGLKGDGGN